MNIEPNIIMEILEEQIKECQDDIVIDQNSFAGFSGSTGEAVEFWKRSGGMRLVGAIWCSDKKAILVIFVSGHHYYLPVDKMKNVHSEAVREVRLDEFQDGVIVEMDGGRTTDFSSDFVLYHCEPEYRCQIDVEYRPDKLPMAVRVGLCVRALRKKKGMSLRAFATAAKMAVANASNLESGKHEPKLETLQRVAQVLGVTIASLVSTR